MTHTLRAAFAGAFILTIMPAVTSAQTASTSSPKFAYVDSRRLLSEAPGRAEAEASFEKEMQGFQAQLKRMDDSLAAMVASYEKAEPTLSPAAKDTRQKNIRAKQAEFQERARRLNEQAQKRQLELVTPIREQVNTILEEIRNTEGYTLIFDVGSDAGLIVAADKNLDITSRVIARMQQLAVKPGAGRPVAGAPVAQPSGVSRPRPPR